MRRTRFTVLDIVLLAVAVLALAAYFWLMPSVHPDRFVNRRITEERAQILASDYIGRSGYSTEGMTAVVELFRDGDVVNDLQDVFGRGAFADRTLPESMRLLRPYYYRVSWVQAVGDIPAVDTEDGMSISLGNTEINNYGSNLVVFSVIVTTDGNVVSLTKTYEQTKGIPVKPALRFLRSNTSTAGWGHQIPAGVPDSMLVKNMGFDITSFRNGPGEVPETPGPEVVVSQGGSYDLNRAEVELLAEYHLRKSIWQDRGLEVDTVVAVSNSLARVRYVMPEPVQAWNVSVEVTVQPYGALEDLKVTYEKTATDINSTELRTLGSLLVIAILVLCLIIVLIRRLDARLIDLKFALTDAILAGLFVDTTLLLNQLFEYQFVGKSLSGTLFDMVPTLIAGGAGAALLMFIISGASESLTRTSGLDTLATLDLLKRGFFFNKAVGMAMLRGVGLGITMAGLVTLPMLAFPDAHLHFMYGSAVFLSHDVTWPALYVIADAGFKALLFSYLIFLGLGGFSWTIRKSWPVLIVVVLLVGTMIDLLPMDIAPLWASMGISASALLFLIWMYRQFGFATTLMGIFVFYLMWAGIPGWMLYRSPDVAVSIVLGSVILAMFSFGAAASAAGQELEEIPEYVPSYVAELSSRERMERELEIARNVQLSFLPASTPEIMGYDINASCRPAFDTGGDFYDFIPLANGNIAVIIGDVSGKGIQAAFYMTLIKGFVQSLSERIESPADVLCEINRLFSRNAEKGTFVTMIYGILEPETGVFTFARAGHNPAVFKPSSDSNPRHIPVAGIGIGLVADDRFAAFIRTQKIVIPENGFIFLYTDGITEAMNLRRELYGDHRLLGQLREIHGESASTIASKVSADVARFVGRAPQHDDMTMVVIRRAGVFKLNYA